MAKQQKTHWFLTLTLIVLGALFIGLLSYKSGRDSVQTEAQQAVNNVREEAEEIIGELKEEQEEEKVVGYDAATKTMSFPELLLIFDEDWDYGGTDEKWSIEPKLREANLFYFGETREDVEQKQSEQAYYQPATLSVMQTEAIEDWEELGTYLEEIELENRAELTVENFSQECDEDDADCKFVDDLDELEYGVEALEVEDLQIYKYWFLCEDICTLEGSYAGETRYFVQQQDGVIELLLQGEQEEEFIEAVEALF